MSSQRSPHRQPQGPAAAPDGGSRSAAPHSGHSDGHPAGGQHHQNGGEHGHHEAAGHDPLAMVRAQRKPWLWTNFLVMMLGVWLITSPFALGYSSAGMTWSDGISGLLLVLFSGAALWPRWDFLGRWAVSVVGVWLQLAPLVFWVPTPAAYANDTLVGALAIAFSILVPMMPGMAHHMAMLQPGPEVPPGWSYNPSSWPQRAILIALGFAGWLISRYLATRQLGYIPAAWEPIFGAGAERVLFSKVSHSLPISDAGLGAFAYTFETLMGFMGTPVRWRSMPWMVTFFGILVVPLGLVHITLVILQPVAVGYWCTLCLAAAFVMLLMIPLAVDEVVAMVQFLQKAVAQGQPLWRTFWVGGTLEGEENEDQRTPAYGSPPAALLRSSVWGVTMPWSLLLSALLGVWMMVAPSVLGTAGPAADSSHVAGALVVTVAFIATAEVIRAGRFLNLLLGTWIVVAPWLLSGAGPAARWNGLAVGLALLLLTLPRGAVREHYAEWDRAIV